MYGLEKLNIYYDKNYDTLLVYVYFLVILIFAKFSIEIEDKVCYNDKKCGFAIMIANKICGFVVK